MKIKHVLLLIGLGWCLSIIGGLMKILHLRLADFLLTIGSFVQVIGIIALLYKVLTHPKAKEFLNW